MNYGLVFTGFGVAGVIGPMLGGKIRDAYGSYHHAFTISAIMLLAGAVLAFILKSPKTEPALLAASPIGDQRTVGEAEAIRK